MANKAQEQTDAEAAQAAKQEQDAADAKAAKLEKAQADEAAAEASEAEQLAVLQGKAEARRLAKGKRKAELITFPAHLKSLTEFGYHDHETGVRYDPVTPVKVLERPDAGSFLDTQIEAGIVGEA